MSLSYMVLRATNDALTESQARLAGVIDSAMDAIITIDPDQNILVFNRAAERMFECPADEAIGQPLERFIPGRFRAAHLQHIRKFGETGVTSREMAGARAVYGLRSGGEEFPVEASISQVTTGTQKLYTVIMRDIGKRVTAEANSARLASIVESSADAIIGKDLSSIITSWNAGAEDLFGYTAADMIGKSIRRLIPDDLQHDEDTIIAKIKNGEWVQSFETIRLRADGTPINVSVTASPIRDSSGTIVGVSKVARDITSRIKAEREVRNLQDELEQRVLDRTKQLDAANKELEAFSYSVSHDLRAPLRHIDGFVQLLAKREAERLDETSGHYLNVISGAVGKMGLLIDELLAFSRTSRQELRLVKVDMNALIKETLKVLDSSTAGRDIKWNIADLPAVEGDVTLLGSVTTNLISNAIKFTRRRDEAIITIGVTDETGDTVTLFVKDNGSGFDMKYVDKLFGVFQRLHRDSEFEGIGIGLATTQKIIHRHGGRIWAKGESDKGACFYFSLKKAAGGVNE